VRYEDYRSDHALTNPLGVEGTLGLKPSINEGS
jgi:hypothetical protein